MLSMAGLHGKEIEAGILRTMYRFETPYGGGLEDAKYQPPPYSNRRRVARGNARKG